MTSFTEKVYTLVTAIPKGKVATYGQVAALLGNPKAARAIGIAMRNNPHPLVMPCHRVVAADGALTGYSYKNGIATKKEILLAEGVEFVGEKVNLQRSQWQPEQ